MKRNVLLLALVLTWGIALAAPEYSPHVGENFPNRVLFGDTHLHTSYSTDAGMVGNRLGPEAAYRFAMGEEVTASTGIKAKLARPLDFLVVADHAENLGLAPAVTSGDPVITKTELGAALFERFKARDPGGAYDVWRNARLKGGVNAVDPFGNDKTLPQAYWPKITAAAEKYNRPGSFSTLIGFEWSAMPGGNNVHRVVIFRDGKDKADTVLPFTLYDSPDPEDLWKWMANYEASTGGKILAIPHNGNLSNGLMFDDVTLIGRKPLDQTYAQQRMRWEPLYEVTQMKGDSETHPLLSANDEFAAFERMDKGSFGTEAKTRDMLPREYAREALKRGLAYDAKLGANPFKFGMIGSTDSHTSLATTEEDNFFGKVTPLEPKVRGERYYESVTGRGKSPEGKDIAGYAWLTSASGLAAVWARENTREAIWDAMARKEVYATTGTRLEVRLFAGFEFAAKDLHRPDWVANGYRKGVPMGGDLKGSAKAVAATFLVKAARSPDGANLDRVQMVKGWLDTRGELHEKVIDLAWSGARKHGKDGRLPSVGNTVDVANASYSNRIGAPVLEAYWKDATFKPDERAFYYVRVIEIPTPRWQVYDAKVFGVTPPKEAPTSVQDRAYTSPVWYLPG
jgi:hypothetical protein